MIQAQTQNADYWVSKFTLTDSDVEQIYNHFLEVEQPQTSEQITRVIIEHRIREEVRQAQRMMADRAIYQPKNGYAVGDELVFPVSNFAQGTVTAVREGYNPEFGKFNVITVEFNGKAREYASDFVGDHALNSAEQAELATFVETDPAPIVARYGRQVARTVEAALKQKPDFVRLGKEWFVKSLLLDINIGHLHLSEAILEMAGGGPLRVDEIAPQLDLDPAIEPSVQNFSLNLALLNDGRFDEVAPVGEVAWFLRRLEPPEVQEPPARLVYRPVAYDRALLSPQLIALEEELDDEWSDLEAPEMALPAVFTLTYPHRWAGTLPLSSRLLPIFPRSNAPRQRVVFVDDETQEEIVGWVVREGRYVFGFKDWFDANSIPVGSFLHLAPGPEPGKIMLGYERRRSQREWVRLATVTDNRVQFTLDRRTIGSGFDDLMIVGTDVVAAVDAVWRRAEANQRGIASLLLEIMPSLASQNPQNAVHAKTIYSAIQLLKRVPPGPIFAELVRNPSFQLVGGHYWQVNSKE